MDTATSFNRRYGKIDPVEEQAYRRKTRKRTIILVVSIVLLLAIIIGVVAGTLAHKKSSGNRGNSSSNPTVQSLQAMCSVTQYPDSCFSSISALEKGKSTTDPKQLFQLSLEVVMTALESLSGLPETWMNETTDPVLKSALQVCQIVFQDAIDATNDSISLFNNQSDPLSPDGISDLETWLSTTLTYLDTCTDALLEINSNDPTILNEVNTAMSNSTQFASNSLAIVSRFLSALNKFNLPGNRKLLSVDSSGFPSWVRAADRKLLQDPSESPKPDVVVAVDGSGDFKTIQEALGKVPQKSNTTFVIYVKAGVYNEKVTVGKLLWNVMIYGDGKNSTIVTGADNRLDTNSTFLTATFTAMGQGFIAKNICFQNTAGAFKQQAVALRSVSDRSVFYNCSFDAFQDTLYAHTNRQFYSNCDIVGTVDFIFGNAAVIFQNCNIMPRQPLSYQTVTITAQGKNNTNQNTGTLIQNCSIFLYPNDNITVKLYLGRPWKPYSTTIYAQNNIIAPIDPQGWLAWNASLVTIFYAEYQNKGPGSDVSKRVTWPGYRSNLTASQLAEFNVANFLQGQSWISAARVTFT